MKKYLFLGIIACAIFFSINVYSQTNTFPASGNAGIGTTSPQYPLDIRHSGYFAGHFQTTASSGQTSFYFENDRGSFGSYGGFLYGGSSCSLGNLFGQTRTDKLFMFADGTSSQGFWAGTLNATPFAIGTNDTERMRILANGNVGIGTVNPQAKLAVNGEIFSRKVKVTQTGWSDYVFHAAYRLRPLCEVEQYIKLYHHLPEVPSAAEVEKDGIDLGDNQATLLKKIEELTLYIISLNKEVEALKKEVRRK